MLESLLDRVHASELSAISKRPEALALVLPAITAILSEVVIDAATDSNTAAIALEVRFPVIFPCCVDLRHGMMLFDGAMELQVLQAMANTLPRRLLETTVLPLVASALHCGSVPMQLACLELGLLSRLQATACLAAFLRTVLPAVLSVVVCDELLADDNGTTPSAAPQVHRTLTSTALLPPDVSAHLPLHVPVTAMC